MRVAMLGPLRVRGEDDTPIEVGGARLRLLLIRLALDPGRVVTADRLAEDVWGDDLPADPAGALQTLVARLRRAFGSERAVIVSHPAGYLLDVAPGSVVEVRAVGVTLPAVRLTRAGRVPLPHAPGGEVAGRVVAIGPGVTGHRIGERVAGLAFTGAYAEFAAVPSAMASTVPDGVGDAAAVLLVRSGQVALGVLDAAAPAEGESVLVTAAAGGVGHLAVQLARTRGASRVVAAVGGLTKAGFLRELGADEVVTYDAEWGGPVDVVLDGAGGEVQAFGLRALAPLGRLVAYNGVGGTLDTNELRMHGRSVIGFAMPHLVARRPDLYERHQRELWSLHTTGRLTAAIHRTLPLEEAGEAHRIIEDRENHGKVILNPTL